MELLKKWMTKPIPLHALEPDETLYERCYWLALFVKQLKGENQELKEQNQQLRAENNMLQVRTNGGQPLTVDEQELLLLRDQVNALWLTNAKLSRRLFNLSTKATHLQTELAQVKEAA